MERCRVVKTCEWCGEEFETIPSHADRRRYCGVVCAGLGRRRECASSRKCPTCGKDFVVQQWKKQVCCSPRCANLSRRKKVLKRCSRCGKEYEAHWNRRTISKYCSVTCLAAVKRKVQHRPSASVLAGLLVHHTLVAIGEMYGVTPNAVRYWAKCHGLEWPDKAERNRLQSLKPKEREALAQYVVDKVCQQEEEKKRFLRVMGMMSSS